MTSTQMMKTTATVALLALGLAACAADPQSPAVTAVNPVELYPLKAGEQTDRIALAVRTDGLSSAQADALKALAQRWR